MKVPLNDSRRQYLEIASEIDAAVHGVLASGWYILGREHDAFEQEFATYCQSQHAVAVANGTDALGNCLREVGCGPGDEVITVANAGGYTTTACLIWGPLRCMWMLIAARSPSHPPRWLRAEPADESGGRYSPVWDAGRRGRHA